MALSVDNPGPAGSSSYSFSNCVDQESDGNEIFESAKAAVKLQKFYRSYHTRRRLADSAVVAEELWWKAIDYARLNHSTISFFNFHKPETAASRWSRVTLNASKVGKGLCQDAKAKKLAFQHWIEAIDPRHRYGHNLNFYYEVWCKGEAGQPFFYWLDIGDGKKVDLNECPRSRLYQQSIKYLGPRGNNMKYIIEEGAVVHKQTGDLLDTNQELQGSKWIFVMSTSKRLYAGEKRKGLFHHSSFLAGGATLAAGSLAAESGKLRCVSAYSGHYRPIEENLGSFIAFLEENGVDLEEVQVLPPTEDYEKYDISKSVQEENKFGQPPCSGTPELQDSSDVQKKQPFESPICAQTQTASSYKRRLYSYLRDPDTSVSEEDILQRIKSKKEASSYQLSQQLALKRSTGAGLRIECIANYSMELGAQALEYVKLSHKDPPSSSIKFPDDLT